MATMYSTTRPLMLLPYRGEGKCAAQVAQGTVQKKKQAEKERIEAGPSLTAGLVLSHGTHTERL